MKKLLFSFLSALIVLFSFAPYFSVTKAQNDGTQSVGQDDQNTTTQTTTTSTWYNQSPGEWYSKVYDSTNSNEIFGERYTAAQVQWIIYSIPSVFFNLITNGNADLGDCLMGATSGSVKEDVCVKGMTSAVEELEKMKVINPDQTKMDEIPSIASQVFADRPISGIGYIKNLLGKFNPVSTVHAETNGFGYKVLTSLKPLWKITRDASFFIFIIITIVFAFMIMFKVKLSPQTIITVQSALPKIIITLILVTFSYAIAGLLVDLMYVLMGLIASLLGPLLGDSSKTIFGFINGTIPVVRDSGLAIIIYFIAYIVAYLIAVIIAIIAAVFGLQSSSVIFGLILFVFSLFLLLILIWSVLKTIFVLFKNLAIVYALIIIAPLQITAGALFPQMGFGTWAKKLFSKLMVFPLTGVFIYIAIALLVNSMWFSLQGLAQNNIIFSTWNDLIVNGLLRVFGINQPNLQIVGLWGPPMLGNPAAASGIAFLLMSLGMIMMIPKISDAIDGFMAGKGFAGSGIGEALGPFEGVGKAAGSIAMREGANPAAQVLAERVMRGGRIDEDTIIGSILNKIRNSSSETRGKSGGHVVPGFGEGRRK